MLLIVWDPEAAYKWRLAEGHAFKHELGGESLVSRICRLDPTVSTAAWHFGSYQTIEEYMKPVPIAYYDGSIITIWDRHR